jgi:hypothetical protein
VGDVVCIWWRPELVTPGRYQGWLKRVRMNAAPWVKKCPYNDLPRPELRATIGLEQLNPATTYVVSCDQIFAIHKPVAYGRQAKIGSTVRSDEQLPIGEGSIPAALEIRGAR